MIDLYTWPTPNGRKVSIALEEFELPYRVHSVDLQQRQQFDPDFLRISPNNKIPAIVDQDTDTALMESGAILLYLAKKTDRFWGEDTWQTMQWLMWQMAGLGPMLGPVHFFNKHNPGQSPCAEERFTAEAARLYGVLDARLAGRSYVSGDYSIADMAIWPWISRFEWQDIDLKDYPNICRWYQEIAQRPAVQKGYDVPHYVNPIPMPN
jgi:GST-like protein